ncbi:MAG: BREX system P-loop protein BrxC [Firmicutes bacterium]|nr:BREX system P-loop protein BrxC [Bacillota bacterium]
MKVREVFLKDPLENRLVNQGVAEVVDPGSEQELRTLRYELETFVCEGQYARGLERILQAYLDNLGHEEQPAVWVSGFYGSGKSHFVKMLRFLWTDFKFPDGATARGIAQVPEEIKALLREVSTQGKRFGGLHAAGGKLGAGAGDSVRLALLGILFRSMGLPHDYAAARFILFLKKNGFFDRVKQIVEGEGRRFESELHDLYVSPILARALLQVDPTFAESEKEVRAQIKAQFPRPADISDADMVATIEEALGPGSTLPLTLIVLDEVQQYIGNSTDRAYRLQEVAEACSKRFGARLLFVGTGQNAITNTPQLEKLQARFRLSVELSDADVDTVVRKIILAKKPYKEPLIRNFLEECSGEISRHLTGTRIGPRKEDDAVLVADYPLLPTRRRFWERAMRAIDPSGTRAELRNQLTNVFEAMRAIAEKSFGTVVAADFIYEQNKTQMVQTGALSRQIQETIERLNDGSDLGRLKSRLCALCFLIGKLPREAGSDIGLRATPETLADLLVEDLRTGSTELRRLIPPLLHELFEAGTLTRVGDEYRLQTPEGAAWEAEYRDRLSRIQNDEAALATERMELLRAQLGETLKGVKLSHGQYKLQRKIQLHFTPEPPPTDGADVPVWVRDGWNDDEKSVLADARAAGTDSPLITVYLPRYAADELKKYIASAKAAGETLNAKGHPNTPEGLEARASMESRLRLAQQQCKAILEEIFSSARVILAGGIEKMGVNLTEKVQEAAKDALQRLYPRFADADHPGWNKVIEHARAGAADALEIVGHEGNPEDHRVCKEILAFVAGGKNGRDIRKHFAAPPYGWPQDAIDGALIVLAGSGRLHASQDGKVLNQKQLDQRNIGVVNFRLESLTITVQQRLELRKLFQEAGVQFNPNEEAEAANRFLQMLKGLARQAGGGDPPLPAAPNPPLLTELLKLSGNEQLMAIYEARENLSLYITEWRKRADLISKRLPRWQSLEQLAGHARGLPIYSELAPQIEAIRTNRTLLSDPDPVPPLAGQLAQALRKALQQARESYVTQYQTEKQKLEAMEVWKRLTPEQRDQILRRHGIASVPDVRVGTEEELLASLAEISLESWVTRRDALAQRFAKALEEATKLLEPKAVRVTLPSATIRTEEELMAWLKEVEARLREQLGKGPVIV